MIHLSKYLLSLNSIHCSSRIISAYKGSSETDKELQLRLVNILLVNEQHMLDALQHHCSQCFFIKVFSLKSMRLLKQSIKTE